jgi:hypothetical protein
MPDVRPPLVTFMPTSPLEPPSRGLWFYGPAAIGLLLYGLALPGLSSVAAVGYAFSFGASPSPLWPLVFFTVLFVLILVARTHYPERPGPRGLAAGATLGLLLAPLYLVFLFAWPLLR